jgi:hypothetical protein
VPFPLLCGIGPSAVRRRRSRTRSPRLVTSQQLHLGHDIRGDLVVDDLINLEQFAVIDHRFLDSLSARSPMVLLFHVGYLSRGLDAVRLLILERRNHTRR